MWQDALTIFHKETNNLFKDRRAVFANFLLPLILMPLIFGAMGMTQGLQRDSMEKTEFTLYVEGSPEPAFMDLLSRNLVYKVSTEPADRANPDTITLVFPAARPTEAGTAPSPLTLGVMADQSSQTMSFALGRIHEARAAWNQAQSKSFLESRGIEPSSLEPMSISITDLATPQARDTGPMVVLLPYLLILYLVTGPLGLALQVTAGEKDQGSLASLLVNQVSRTSIALGKILYVVVSGLLNAVSSLSGILIAMALMTNLAGDGAALNMAVLLDPLTLGATLLIMLSTSAMAASLLVFLGSSARNMKEASGYTLPVMMVSVIAGVATMGMDPAKELGFYAVPILNSIFGIKSVLVGKLEILPLVLTLGVNLAVTMAGTWLTARVYNSEKVLYTV